MTSLVARSLSQSSRKPMRYVLQEALLSIVKSESSVGQLLDSSQPLQHLAINKRSSEAIYYSAQEGGQFYKILFSDDESGKNKKVGNFSNECICKIVPIFINLTWNPRNTVKLDSDYISL